MTFFVFLVAGILHSSGNLSYFSGRGGLSSGKMKFLVQFAIRCECKRPLPLPDIEKREGQIDGNVAGEIERGGPEIGSQRAKCIGRPNVICDTGDCPLVFFPRFFRSLVSAALAAKFDISRAIKSNLLRRRFVPSARVISMASTSDRRAWERRANNTVDFKRSYVHATPVDFISSVSYSFRSILVLAIEKQC